MNQYLDQAKAVIARSKEMIANNESKTYDLEIKLGGGEYSDSASLDPKPFKGGYTQNHGGMISAKVEAEFYLKAEWRKLSDMKETAPFVKHPDYELISEADDYLVEQAQVMGFEL